MEETEINSIAKAVSAAVGKLNEDTKKEENKEPRAGTPETFNCPDCGTAIKALTTYCPNCGLALDWEE